MPWEQGLIDLHSNSQAPSYTVTFWCTCTIHVWASLTNYKLMSNSFYKKNIFVLWNKPTTYNVYYV